MSFVVVDASIWVSRLVPQDEFHLLCKSWLAQKRTAGTILVSPTLLLVEVAGAISHRTGDTTLAERAVQNLEHLTSLRLVEMGQTVIETAAALAAKLGMRGADAIYVAVAQHLNIGLATLDEDQRNKASKVISIEILNPQSGH